LFNHLDYSFVAGQESGDFVYPASQPGGGNPGFRRQLRVLAGFVSDLRVWELEPLPELVLVAGGEERVAHGLGKAGRAYGVYLAPMVKDWKQLSRFAERATTVAFAVPAGRYQLRWMEPLTGRVLSQSRIRHGGGRLQLESPPFREDLAFRLER
jgi:hypothetical protein